MRLKEIKLAGFKSFVDPTTVSLPGNRSAVVGPNGCGKSNIIDAVRWVMGESSAKQLRGEALTDVIFNGSRSRQPTSLASIELLFDNSAGRVGGKTLNGKFAAYSEIAVRREVSRDAKSAYYLNGSRCRRRDINDVFLGTGFGPRSYSIIEQGMISELVEAKPEALRAYLEEAAGTTIYKERRRETSNRIRRAEENLASLGNVRELLAERLAHLQRQAKAAERFRELKSEETMRTAELLAIQLVAAEARLREQVARANDLEVEHDAAMASRQAIDTALEKSRAALAEQNEEVEAAMQRDFGLAVKARRLEVAIDNAKGRLQEHEEDLRSVAELQAKSAAELDEDATRIRATRADIAAREPALAQSAADDSAAAKRLEDLERQAQAGQQAREEFSGRQSETETESRVRRGSIAHATAGLRRLRDRAAKLDAEASAGDEAEQQELARSLDALARKVEAAEQRVGELANRVRDGDEAVAAQRGKLDQLQSRFDAADGELQRQRSALAALDAVQQAALGRDANHGGAVAQWLDANGLRTAPRLGERLQVEPGWERAVETVLGGDLQAVLVDDAGGFATGLACLPSGRATLVETGPQPTDDGALPALAELARRESAPVGALLAGVFAADTVDIALRHRAALRPGQSIVTRDGLWLGTDWIRLDKGAADAEGVIRRAREIDAGRAAVAAAEAELAERSRALDAARARLTKLDEERDAARASRAETASEVARLQSTRDERRKRLREAQERSRRAAAERQQLDDDIETQANRLRADTERLAELDAAAETLRAEGEALRLAREQDDDRLQRARRLAREAHDAHFDQRKQRDELAAKLDAIETARGRLLDRQREQEERSRKLRDAVATIKDESPARQDALTTVLAEKSVSERQLADARRRYGEIDDAIRAAAEQRNQAEQRVEAVNEEWADAREHRGSLETTRDHLRKAQSDTGIDADDARRGLPEDASEEQWRQKLDKLARRIARLGSINLAAIDDFRAQSERKLYLDRQNDDIEASLATLRDAMEKIDSDTRARFKATFEQVNEQLNTVFPAVFGGGRAHLEMTGNDWLGAGVTLMAQPPGKRNTSIHLLSGGEKAMTAVALLFSIFRLNPSPVCLLDEVDAPLDDTNVERFAELIRDMSDEVQFVVITHNKHTIEMADHLLGVTMQEAGVSRLVSVDVEKAARMAATG